MAPATNIRQIVARPWVRLLLILLYLAAGSVGLTLLFRFAWPRNPGVAGGSLVRDIVSQFVAAMMAVGGLFLFFRGFQRRRPEEFGFPLSAVGRPLRRGFILGAVLIGVVLMIITLSGNYKAGIRSPGAIAGSFWVLLQELLIVFFGAIFEETAVRGLIFQTLEEWLGSWTALGASALFFGFAHAFNPGANVLSCLAVAVEGGGLLTAAFVLTRNLWFPIGIHWAWNFFQGPVFGLPVSGTHWPSSLLEASVQGPIPWTGGAFGPEAGLPAVIFATGLSLTILGQAAAQGALRRPIWRRESSG